MWRQQYQQYRQELYNLKPVQTTEWSGPDLSHSMEGILFVAGVLVGYIIYRNLD